MWVWKVNWEHIWVFKVSKTVFFFLEQAGRFCHAAFWYEICPTRKLYSVVLIVSFSEFCYWQFSCLSGCRGESNQQISFLIEVNQIFIHAYLGNMNLGSRMLKLFTVLNKPEMLISIWKKFIQRGFTHKYLTKIALLYKESKFELGKNNQPTYMIWFERK